MNAVRIDLGVIELKIDSDGREHAVQKLDYL